MTACFCVAKHWLARTSLAGAGDEGDGGAFDGGGDADGGGSGLLGELLQSLRSYSFLALPSKADAQCSTDHSSVARTSSHVLQVPCGMRSAMIEADGCPMKRIPIFTRLFRWHCQQGNACFVSLALYLYLVKIGTMFAKSFVSLMRSGLNKEIKPSTPGTNQYSATD